MRTLIVGIGALGGLLGARLAAAGAAARLAARDAASAAALRASGLRAGGVGGEAVATRVDALALEELGPGERFELVVLATKAHDAIAVAPRLAERLAPGGTLLPIQNGGVAQLLAERLGEERVLGGLSNLGASMIAPGVVEQRNAGHLLVGELAGGASERAERVRAWLGRGVEVRSTANLRGAVWSKLIINCSVTTIGALAGCPMRGYIDTAPGRALYDRAYDEALAVALASGARPEKMLVEPVPPPQGEAREAWLRAILAAYGDLRPSMLHDLERGRTTEVDFINGYVVELGRRLGVAAPANAAIVEAVRAIGRGELAPGPAVLRRVLDAAG
jgi:2-dehydropantoate 2-reductase